MPKEIQTLANETMTEKEFRLPSGRFAFRQHRAGDNGPETDLASDSLDGLCEIIELLGKELVNEETVSEYVIVYCLDLQASYWRMPDGRIFPNGGFDPEGSGKWVGDLLAASSVPTFSVGIGARVAEKRKHISRSGATCTTYHFPERSFLGEYGKKLMDFVKIVTFNEWQKELRENHFEIPYTEDAAKFFSESIERICRLSDIIRENLTDPEKVREQIRLGSSPPLSLPPLSIHKLNEAGLIHFEGFSQIK